MARWRVFTMGDGTTSVVDQSTMTPAQIFTQELSIFQSSLSTLLSTQATLLGQRSTAIFQYITGWMTRFGQCQAAVLNQAMADNNTDGGHLALFFMNHCQNIIPMSDINGVISSRIGWAINQATLNMGSVFGLDPFLLPSGILLNTPASISRSTSATPPLIYQFYKSIYSLPIGRIIDTFWMVDGNYAPGNDVSIPPGTANNHTPVPPTPAWFDAYLAFVKRMTGFPIQPVNGTYNLQENYVVGLMSQDFGSGSFASMISDGLNLYLSIVNMTMELVALQNQIDAEMDAVTAFLTANTAYAANLTAESILQGVQSALNAPPQAVVTPAPTPAPIPAVVVTAPPPAPTPAPAATVSPMVLLGAAAAAALVLLGGKK
jgi:hypothetical protein